MGQVLLIGGWDENQAISTAVHKVDLATGVCTAQPALPRERYGISAARLPDGRVVCAGGWDYSDDDNDDDDEDDDDDDDEDEDEAAGLYTCCVL
jgi:glycine/D-amino acid oxidase-like deaminating enzyme